MRSGGILAAFLLLGLSFSQPSIDFTAPTPANNSTFYTSSIYVNTSVNGTGNLSAFIDFNRSLAGYWSFDNISGATVYDSSTYGNDGTNSGATNASGMFGNALDFGGNAYVNLGNTASLNPSQVTVEAWVKPASANMGQYARIVEKLYSNSYYLGADTSGTKFKGIFANPTSPYGTLESTTVVSAGTWYHVVITHDGTNDYLYVNGVLESTQANAATPNNAATSVLIGRYSAAASAYFNGSIDEVRIWNRALSPEEINASYNAGLYRLERNFANLSPGNYSFYAYAVDSSGASNTTETREVQLLPAPISFVPPTPADGSILYVDSIYVNTTRNWTGNLSAFIDFNRSLAAYWSFDNVSGSTIYDSSTYGNDGTITGALNSSGQFGDSRHFDGGDYVSAGTGMSGYQAITLEAWVKPDSTATTTYGKNAVISKWDADSNKRSYYLGINGYNTAGSVVFGVSTSGTNYLIYRTGSVLSAGSWSHIVGIYNGTGFKIYVNGVDRALTQAATSGTLSGVINSNDAEVQAGAAVAYSSTRNFFNGSIDEARIWDRALSPEEINASYNAGLYRLERNFTGLSSGSYPFYAWITNSSGTSYKSETRTVSLANAFELQSPVAATYYTQSLNISLDYTLSSPASSCWYSLNGGANVSLPSCLNSTFAPQAGANTITVYVNSSGIVHSSNPVSFSVNTTNICDSGDLDTECNITTNKVMQNNSMLYGSGNLVVRAGATLTPSTGYLKISIQSLTVESGASIHADGKGYSCPHTDYCEGLTGYGPGGGGAVYSSSIYAAGAGYGGNGGAASSAAIGPSYGSIPEPLDIGSAGGTANYYCGNYNTYGGSGGGAIYLYVSGALNNSGTISANGNAGYVPSSGKSASGGGSGGSVYIVAGTIDGNGAISANGGNGAVYAGDQAGGGAGGRIAIYYTDKPYSGTVTVSAGSGAGAGTAGGAGTIYMKNSSLQYGDLSIPNNVYTSAYTPINGTNAMSFNSITANLSSPYLDMTSPINVSENFTMLNSVVFAFSSSSLVAPSNIRNLAILSGSTLTANSPFAGIHNLILGNTSSITHSANSDSQVYWINISAGNVTLESGASINANAKGYSCPHTDYCEGLTGYGPGGGGALYSSSVYAAGGAYGGGGGAAGSVGESMMYGNLTHPPELGSAGGTSNYYCGNYNTYGGSGGGAIYLYVSGTLNNSGTISANGNAGYVPSSGKSASGGGSGGSVYIVAGTIDGNGAISANGGNGAVYAGDQAGGGAGGRIAIYYTDKPYSGTINANGGSGSGGQNGGAGTIFQKSSAQNYGDLSISNSITSSTTTSFANQANRFDNIYLGGAALTLVLTQELYSGNITLNGTITLLDNKSISASESFVLRAGSSITSYANSDTMRYWLNLSAGNMTIEPGASMHANAKGYSCPHTDYCEGLAGYGPGGGGAVYSSSIYAAGAGYGGNGGAASSAAIGPSYGSIPEPLDIGSAGGTANYYCGNYNTYGGSGGGAIYLYVSGTLNNSGTISANGNAGYVPSSGRSASGGGSGGSVYIVAGSLDGNGAISANGGNGAVYSTAQAGGGAGGRIAIYYTDKPYSGTIAVSAGSGAGGGAVGGAGTIYYGNYTILLVGAIPSMGTTLQPLTVYANYSYASAPVQGADVRILIFAEPAIYASNRSFAYNTYTMGYNSSSGFYEYYYVPKEAGKIFFSASGNKSGFSRASLDSFYEINGTLISINFDKSTYLQDEMMNVSGYAYDYLSNSPFPNINITFYIDGIYAGSTLTDASGNYSALVNATGGGYHVLVANTTG